MPLSRLTSRPFALAILLLATCPMMWLAGCVIVVDADHDHECVLRHHDAGSPRIGLDIDHVDAALAGQLGIAAERATLVRAVRPGWPAEQAGVRQFDVITNVDGSDDASPGALQNAIRAKHPGEVVTLTVIRNAQPTELSVTITEHPH